MSDKLELTSMGSLCEVDNTDNNKLNGLHIEYEDFGEQYDENPEEAEDYSCGNMQFSRKDATKEVLIKYNIGQDEYDLVCDQLEEILSFGNCGWCS